MIDITPADIARIARIDIFSLYRGFHSRTAKLSIVRDGHRWQREELPGGQRDELEPVHIVTLVVVLSRSSMPELIPDLFGRYSDFISTHYSSVSCDDSPTHLVKITLLTGGGIRILTQSNCAFMLPFTISCPTRRLQVTTWDAGLSLALAALMPPDYLEKNRLSGEGWLEYAYQSHLAALRDRGTRRSPPIPSESGNRPQEPAPSQVEERAIAGPNSTSMIANVKHRCGRLMSLICFWRRQKPDSRLAVDSAPQSDPAAVMPPENDNRRNDENDRAPKAPVSTLVEEPSEAADETNIQPEDERQESDACRLAWLAEATNPSNKRALLWAASPPFNGARFRELVRAGANVDARDTNGSTGLQVSCAGGMLVAVKAWIKAGAALEVRGPEGATALMFATRWHRITKLLLSAGADANAVDDFGRSPLVYGIMRPWYLGTRGWHAAIYYLLAAGAKVNLRDHDGMTPLDHARRQLAVCRVKEEAWREIFPDFDRMNRDNRLEREEAERIVGLIAHAADVQCSPHSGSSTPPDDPTTPDTKNLARCPRPLPNVRS